MHLELDIVKLYLKPLLIGELAPEEPSQERHKNVSESEVSALKSMWRDGDKVYFRANLSFSVETSHHATTAWMNKFCIFQNILLRLSDLLNLYKTKQWSLGPCTNSNPMSISTYFMPGSSHVFFFQWLLVLLFAQCLCLCSLPAWFP